MRNETHPSPIGELTLVATDAGLARIGLPGDDVDAPAAPPTDAQRAILDRAHRELDEYFAGERTTFTVPLDWTVNGFRRSVLEATAFIPYGDTASYGAVAARAGSVTATRAAGTALATNPLPIVVPCHRVLPASGALGAYRGGPEMKRALLDLERS
jgi:methylated-DNA-[protein]-cysteine S-methyltransferase